MDSKRRIVASRPQCRSNGLRHFHRSAVAGVRSVIVKQDRLVIACHPCRGCNGRTISDPDFCICLTARHDNGRCA